MTKKTPIPSPENKDEFRNWFLNKLKNNQFNFNTLSAKLKESGRLVTISSIEGIAFHKVPEKYDWLLYYVYHYGFDRKEIYDQAPTSTLYQMLRRITSREAHKDLYNRLLYVVSTRNGLKSLSFTDRMRKYGITLPADLTGLTLKDTLTEMHSRAEELKATGWLSADIDLLHLNPKRSAVNQ